MRYQSEVLKHMHWLLVRSVGADAKLHRGLEQVVVGTCQDQMPLEATFLAARLLGAVQVHILMELLHTRHLFELHGFNEVTVSNYAVWPPSLYCALMVRLLLLALWVILFSCCLPGRS